MLSLKKNGTKKYIKKLYAKINGTKKRINYLYCKVNGTKKYLFMNEDYNRFYLLKKGVVQVSYVTNNTNGTYTEGTGFQVTSKYYHPVFNKTIASAIEEGYKYLCYKINSTNGAGVDCGSVSAASNPYSWVTRKPTTLSVGDNIVRVDLTDYSSGYPSVCLCNMSDTVQTDTQTLYEVWFEKHKI